MYRPKSAKNGAADGTAGDAIVGTGGKWAGILGYTDQQRAGSKLIAEVRKISETGKILRGKYCLLQEIGRGGEGVVYLARDTELGKRWCIKCTEKSPGIRLLCQLEHDHLPQVVDYWEEENCAVLVMEYIAGKTLQEVLRAGTVTRRQGMEWTRQLLHVVSYLHRQSPPLLHGDLKPENLMISTEGQLYLIDFGSARLLESDRRGEQKGTKEFAAPEQWEGKRSIESDIYGLGKTLELLWKQAEGNRCRMNAVWRKCTRKKAKDRFHDCRELEQELEHCFTVMERPKQDSFHLLLVTAGLLVMLFTGISLNRAGMMQTEGESFEDGSGSGETVQEEEMEGESPWVSLHRQVVDFFSEEDDRRRRKVYAAVMKMGEHWLMAERGAERSHVLLLLAQVCEKQEENDQAEMFYREWIQDNPEEGEGIALYGLMLLRQEQTELSWKLYQENRQVLGKSDSRNVEIWQEKLRKWRKEYAAEES